MFPEILLTSAVFLSALLSAFLCLLLNVGILKRRLKRWNSNATIYFIMSLGNAISVNRHKKERWQVVHGYSEDESAAILQDMLDRDAGWICRRHLAVGKILRPAALTRMSGVHGRRRRIAMSSADCG